MPQFENTFLNFMFYQPFSSDLDRGFSIINYDINEELVSKEDLAALRG
jgi:sucrose phosphorylase